MKKNIFAMIVVILSGAAAQAICHFNRLGDPTCVSNDKFAISKQSEQVHCSSSKATLDFKFDQSSGVKFVSYNYTVTTVGRCPSRNCGSSNVEVVSGSSDQGGMVADVWGSYSGGVVASNLNLNSSLDADKNFLVSYVVTADQLKIQNLSIGQQGFDAASLSQFTCVIH